MILLRKSYSNYCGHVLKPTGEDSVDALHKLKHGQEVSVEMKRARSGQQHRLFFALMKKAFDNQQTDFPTMDALRKAVLIEAGYFEPQQRLTGEVVNVARSISFHNMKQEEFNKCFQDCVETICKYVMPGMDPETLINEVGQ